MKLFVYGTLKVREQHKGHFLSKDTLLGTYTVPKNQNFCLFNLGGFPGVVKVPDPEYATEVVGEVHEVDEHVYKQIERYEGYPTLYVRGTVETPYGEAELYVYNDPAAYLTKEVCEDGVW